MRLLKEVRLGRVPKDQYDWLRRQRKNWKPVHAREIMLLDPSVSSLDASVNRYHAIFRVYEEEKTGEESCFIVSSLHEKGRVRTALLRGGERHEFSTDEQHAKQLRTKDRIIVGILGISQITYLFEESFNKSDIEMTGDKGTFLEYSKEAKVKRTHYLRLEKEIVKTEEGKVENHYSLNTKRDGSVIYILNASEKAAPVE
jgi:hypothetical protein